MLEGLGAIDWSQYYHAYGEAVDLPDAIRDLTHTPLAEDDDIVEEALDRLFNTIWHQGTVYTATAVAVPFLIEILAHDATTEPDAVLELLHSCGDGSGFLEAHGSLETHRYEQDTPEFQAQIEREVHNVQAAHQAVVAGWQTYIQFLSHDDALVRRAAAEVLAICDSQRDAVAEALIDRIAIERELDAQPPVLVELVRSLGQMLTYPRRREERVEFEPGANTLFMAWVADPSFPADGRVMAAIFLIYSGDEAGRAAALDFVAHIPDGPPLALSECIFDLVDALEAHDVHLALSWLARMVNYGDLPTARQLAYITNMLYGKYREIDMPVLNILRGLMAHPYVEVRQSAVMYLQALGGIAHIVIPILKREMAVEQDRYVSMDLTRITNTIEVLENDPHLYRPLAGWLAHDGPTDLPLAELLDRVEEALTGGPPFRREIPDLLGSLADVGPAALDDPRTLPLLEQALSYDSEWVRVRAARALALFAPQQTQALTVPVLIDQVRGRDASLVAMDTLQILARAGVDVSTAQPQLHLLAESPLRQVESGMMPAPMSDKQLQQVARTTLDTLRALGQVPD